MALAEEQVAHYELVDKSRTSLHYHPALCTDLFIFTSSNLLVWANMPVSLTELAGLSNWRFKFDFKDYRKARFQVNVVAIGHTTAYLGVQYSLDLINWSYLCGGTDPSVNIASSGLKVSNWFSLEIDSLLLSADDSFLRVVGWGGNSIRDPSFSMIRLQVK